MRIKKVGPNQSRNVRFVGKLSIWLLFSSLLFKRGVGSRLFVKMFDYRVRRFSDFRGGIAWMSF